MSLKRTENKKITSLEISVEKNLLIRNFNSTLKKSEIFRHQYQRQVKMYISFLLFHDLFPLEFLFIKSISLIATGFEPITT